MKLWSVGCKGERKNFEYTIVATFEHPEEEGVYMYTVCEREFGTTKCDFYVWREREPQMKSLFGHYIC